MKKFFPILVMISLGVAGFCQTAPRDIKVDPMLYSVMTPGQVEAMRNSDPKQLVVENFKTSYYCFLALKMTEPEGTYNMKDDLRNHVKAGKVCDYQSIIQTGCINPHDYDLEQDPYRLNVYPMGTTGAYIIVFSKILFDQNLQAKLREYGF